MPVDDSLHVRLVILAFVSGERSANINAFSAADGPDDFLFNTLIGGLSLRPNINAFIGASTTQAAC